MAFGLRSAIMQHPGQSWDYANLHHANLFSCCEKSPSVSCKCVAYRFAHADVATVYPATSELAALEDYDDGVHGVCKKS